MSRAEFSKKTKLLAWDRCGGHCEATFKGHCNHARIIGTPIYDHILVEYTSHDNSLENCQVLCSRCNKIKTYKADRPAIDKTRRIIEKRAGLRKSCRGFRKPPDGYDPWTRRMKGE
jgi:5-methylcytosine-specific restriction endonuclease McrA